jgi:hypothetical protein
METQTENKINALIEREVKICNNKNLNFKLRKEADIRILVLREVLKE